MPRRFIAILSMLICGFPPAVSAQGPWQSGAVSTPQVMPTGWHGDPGWGAMPAGHWQAGGFPPSSPIYEELVPRHTAYHQGEPAFDLAIRDTIASSWFRLDYLHFQIQPPGNGLLGAPMATTDPTQPFPAVDRLLGVRPLTAAVVPVSNDFELSNLNGIRATLGVPTRYGTFEFNTWGLEEGSHILKVAPRVDPLLGIVVIPGTTLLNQGVPSDTRMILYDTSYKATLNSQLFSTEASFITAPLEKNVPIEVHPTFGVKYVRFYEDFRIRGTDFFTGTNHLISARGHNNYILAGLGLRMETHLDFLTFGIEPKFLIGVNRHKDSVYTEEIYDALEAPNLTGTDDTDFAAGFELQAYGKVHLNEHITLFVGYNLVTLSDAARPTNMIRYNDSGLANPPDIVYQRNRQSFYTHGLMIGGEIYFW